MTIPPPLELLNSSRKGFCSWFFSPWCEQQKTWWVFNLQEAVTNFSSHWQSLALVDSVLRRKLKYLLQFNGLLSLVLLLSQPHHWHFLFRTIYLTHNSFFFPPLRVHLTLVWVYTSHFTMNGAFVHFQFFSPRNNPAEITRITLGKKSNRCHWRNKVCFFISLERKC